MVWWAWLVLGAMLLGAELFAIEAQFYLVFLGVSAALVGLAGLFGLTMPVWGQWLAFTVIALFFFFTFRKTLYAKIHGGGAKYKQEIKGASLLIPDELAPGGETRAAYRGSKWTVRNVGDDTVAAGSRATIVEVDGLILHVQAD
ncbi:MAG: NfeD family protein [Pseudomonadota bacterium]